MVRSAEKYTDKEGTCSLFIAKIIGGRVSDTEVSLLENINHSVFLPTVDQTSQKKLAHHGREHPHMLYRKYYFDLRFPSA